jgi:hypothetical protein
MSTTMKAAGLKTLSRFLTTPSKVANALDWRKASGGCILSMSIGKDTIDLAVASHPESSPADDFALGPQSLPSIPLKTQVINNKRVLSPAVVEELSKIMNDWNVCGTVVSWPVQEEGWAGASCGRVLFTLDQLVSSQSSSGSGVISDKRKVCLWNQSHHECVEDSWGRCPVYAKTSDKTIHFASKEQYQAPKTLAADVWNDFCRAHWPEMYQYNEEAVASTTSTAPSHSSWVSTPPSPAPLFVNTAWLEEQSSKAYSQATLL